MPIPEEQLQEWELAASQRQYRFCIDLADLFVQAVPALIAELREAREQQKPEQENCKLCKAHARICELEAEAVLFNNKIIDLEIERDKAKRQAFEAENRANLIAANLKFERELHAKTEAELAEAKKDAALSFVSLPHWGHTKFKLGDQVRKIKGSQWHGMVVGTYSTSLTPEGYAVESSTEQGSVQIYPASALEFDCVVQQEEAK